MTIGSVISAFLIPLIGWVPFLTLWLINAYFGLSTNRSNKMRYFYYLLIAILLMLIVFNLVILIFKIIL